MKFIHGKCNPSTFAPPVLSGGRPAGKQLCTNRPGGQVEHEPAACSCSKNGQQCPGLYLRAFPKVEAGDPAPPLSTAGTHVECWVQYDRLKSVLQRATEHLSYKDRLRELGLFRPEQRRLRDQSNQYALNTWPSTSSSQKIDSSLYHHYYLPQTYNVGIVNQELP